MNNFSIIQQKGTQASVGGYRSKIESISIEEKEHSLRALEILSLSLEKGTLFIKPSPLIIERELIEDDEDSILAAGCIPQKEARLFLNNTLKGLCDHCAFPQKEGK